MRRSPRRQRRRRAGETVACSARLRHRVGAWSGWAISDPICFLREAVQAKSIGGRGGRRAARKLGVGQAAVKRASEMDRF